MTLLSQSEPVHPVVSLELFRGLRLSQALMLDVPVWFSISGLSFPSLHLQSCLEWYPTWCRAPVLVSIYYCGFCGSSVNPAISVAVCRPRQGFCPWSHFFFSHFTLVKGCDARQSSAILVLKPVCSACCWTVSSRSSVPRQCWRCNLVVTSEFSKQYSEYSAVADFHLTRLSFGAVFNIFQNSET